jgi:hypothetical protein
MEIDITFDSFNKTYNKGSNITGSVVVSSSERVCEFQALFLNLVVSRV